MTDLKPPIHPDIVPDDDPRTVDEIVQDADPQEPTKPLDFLAKLKSTSSGQKTSGRRPSASAGRAKKDTPPKSGFTKTTSPVFEPGKVKETFSNLYGDIAMMWGMFDPICAKTLAVNAEKMAQSLEDAAEEIPFIRTMAARISTTSAVGGIIAAHLPLIATVVMHHTPQGQRKMAQMAEQAQRAQQEQEQRTA